MISSLLNAWNDDNSETIADGFFNFTHTKNNKLSVLTDIDVALIFDDSHLSSEVRKHLGNFKNHFKNIKIVDLGRLNQEEDQNFTDLFKVLIEENIIPIFMGVSLDKMYKLALEEKYDLHFMTNNLPFVHEENIKSKNYIGYQRHLCELKEMHQLEQTSYNSLSLGKIRSSPSLLEPTLRNTELLYLNLNVIRSAEASNVKDSLPSGLNAEELCQLIKFVGTSDSLKAVCIDYDLEDAACKTEGMLIAEAIWYFQEGKNMSINDHPSVNSDYCEFVVYSNYMHQDLVFLKNNQSNKWWLKIIHDVQLHYLACSYEEYQLSISDEIPERIMKFLGQV